MLNAATLLALALTSYPLVQGVNQPPPAPYNSQIGKLRFPLSCTVLGFLSETFQVEFSGTGAVFGGSGEDIYMTDSAGNITIPASLVELAPLFGATQASANVSVYLNASNASPATLLAFQTIVSNVTFPSSGDAVIRFPSGNGTLGPIGPFALGTEDEVTRLFLGDIGGYLNLQNAAGDNVFGPISLDCDNQPIDYILASVNVNSSTGGAPLAPANGYIPNFNSIPELYETGYYNFPYGCDFGSLGNASVNLIIGGNIAAYFAPNSEFNLTEAEAFLQIPSDIIASAKEQYPNVTEFDVSITDFELDFTNTNPTTLNAAATPFLATVDVTDADNAFIAIPQTGELTFGPITTGSAGEIVSLRVGVAQASISLKDSSGAGLGSVSVSCNVPAPLELISVPITTTNPNSTTS